MSGLSKHEAGPPWAKSAPPALSIRARLYKPTRFDGIKHERGTFIASRAGQVESGRRCRALGEYAGRVPRRAALWLRHVGMRRKHLDCGGRQAMYGRDCSGVGCSMTTPPARRVHLKYTAIRRAPRRPMQPRAPMSRLRRLFFRSSDRDPALPRPARPDPPPGAPPRRRKLCPRRLRRQHAH